MKMLITLLALVAMTAHADEEFDITELGEPVVAEKEWWENLVEPKVWWDCDECYAKPYVLTIIGEEEPYFFELPDDYGEKVDCVRYGLKLMLMSKDRNYSGFICERGRAKT